MKAKLPQGKLEKARAAVKGLLTIENIPHKALQSSVGLLNFATRVVLAGRAYLRRLYDALQRPVSFHNPLKAIGADLI